MSFAERRVTDMNDIRDEENELTEELKELAEVPVEEPVKKTVKSRRRGAARSVLL